MAFALAVGLVTGLAACVSSGDAGRADAPASPAPRAAPEGAAMIVFLRELSFEPGIDDLKNESFVVDCVRSAIEHRDPDRRFVDYETFRRAALPELKSRSTLRQPKYLRMVLDHPDFRTRIAPLGLRYIIFVGGVTETNREGGIACGGGGGGAGCFGLITWDKESRMVASVLDLARRGNLLRSEALATGTAWFAMIGIFPLGMPAGTEGVTCTRQGEKIAALLEEQDAAAER